MRKALFLIAVVAMLAIPCVATAAGSFPIRTVACSGACDSGGGGWTGCTTQTESHTASLSLLAYIRHYLVVSYCKRYGVITSISIAAHGCDTGGLVSCSPGPAWLTGGGVGYGSASFEAHASWKVNTLPLYNNYDILTLTVPTG